jgi:DNA-binding NarL/FixJ family response regulator
MHSGEICVIVCVEREHGPYQACSRELKARFGDKIGLVHFPAAKTALDYLSSNRADLVISSLMQAEINGIDLLNTCKELYPSLPFIIYTVLEHKEDFFAWGSKPDAYVVRSSEYSVLLDAVEKLLNLKEQ